MLRLLAILALLASPIEAQTLLGVAGPNNTYGSGSGPFVCPQAYCGPGDIATGATAFYSAGRAYNNAYAAAQSPLADIVDTTTGLATCTINAATSGYVNLTAVVCPTSAPVVNVVTFCTVTHVGCSVTKLYDQTGNGNNVVQATLANMPALTLSAQNGLPCSGGTGSSTLKMATAAALTQAQPYSLAIVAERTGNYTTYQTLADSQTRSTSFFFDHTANNLDFFTGSVSSTGTITLPATDNAPHAAIAVSSSTSPYYAVDSTSNSATSFTAGANPLGGIFDLLIQNTAFPLLTGFLCEATVWPSAQNANVALLLANMRSSTNGWNF